MINMMITKNKFIIKKMEKLDYWIPFRYRGKIYFKTFQYNIVYFPENKLKLV